MILKHWKKNKEAIKKGLNEDDPLIKLIKSNHFNKDWFRLFLDLSLTTQFPINKNQIDFASKNMKIVNSAEMMKMIESYKNEIIEWD